jgi:hypothetical protein
VNERTKSPSCFHTDKANRRKRGALGAPQFVDGFLGVSLCAGHADLAEGAEDRAVEQERVANLLRAREQQHGVALVRKPTHVP